MKKKKENKFHKLKCAGCGRYEKEVDKDVHTYFCNHCFVDNSNYSRNKYGKELIRPISSLKKGDIVEDLKGNLLKISKKAYIFQETSYFFAYEINDKEKNEILLGDYQVVRKIDKKYD